MHLVSVRIRRFSQAGRQLPRRVALNRCRMTSVPMSWQHCDMTTPCIGESNVALFLLTVRDDLIACFNDLAAQEHTVPRIVVLDTTAS